MTESASPHPGFFEVLTTRRAYTSLLYLMLCLVTGTLAFAYAVTGLSLSLGLAILIVGLPVAAGFLLGARVLAVTELRLLGLLVDGTRAPGMLPPGEGFWIRLKSLAADGRTWTSLLYFLLLLPLGVAYFTLLLTLLSLGLGLLLVPVVRVLHLSGSFTTDLGGFVWTMSHPNLTAVLCGLAGVALVPLSLHLALLLGRFQSWLARHLLVRA